MTEIAGFNCSRREFRLLVDSLKLEGEYLLQPESKTSIYRINGAEIKFKTEEQILAIDGVSPNRSILDRSIKYFSTANECRYHESETDSDVDINWLHLKKNMSVVFKIIGNLWNLRKCPEDPRMMLVSRMWDDLKTAYRTVIWKQIEEYDENGFIEEINADADWFLYRFHEDVLREGQGSRTHQKIKWNKPKYGRYTDFGYKKRIAMNVVERSDNIEPSQKNYSILTAHTSGGSINSLHKEYDSEIGFPEYLYNKIFEITICAERKWGSIIRVKKIKKDYSVNLIETPVNEKTRNDSDFQLYNLDYCFRPTTYTELYRNFKYLIAGWDVESGSTFIQDLLDLVMDEWGGIRE